MRVCHVMNNLNGILFDLWSFGGKRFSLFAMC